MATEMALPRNGNKDVRNTATEIIQTPRHPIPEFLTGNPLNDQTNEILN